MSDTPTPLDHARSLNKRGFAVVPVPFKQKEIWITDWPNLRIAEADLRRYFSDAPSNIGILVGEPSGWIVDIDLDHLRAVALADTYLPFTNAVFGREGKPRSHRLYRVTGPIETRKFVSNTAGMIVEIRSTGVQTVAPGSVHPSGEAVRWDSDGEPSTVTPGDLIRMVKALFDAVKAELGEADAPQPSPPPRGPRTRPGSGSAYARAALRSEADAVRAAPEGSRNDRLNEATFKMGTLAGAGAIDAAEVLAELRQAARECGLPDREIESTLKSGLRAGEKQPRQLPPAGGNPPRGPSVGSVGAPGGGNPDSWPAPRALPTALPPVIAFDPRLLPEAFRGWVVDISDRVQCPIDFVAVATMVALAALVGRKIAIRPKRNDDWTVVPNLWGGAIGRPGVMKTPAIQEPLKPLKRLEIEAKKAYCAQIKDAEAADRVRGLQKSVTDAAIRKALKNPEEAFRLARESIDEETDEPVRKRYIVNDSTVEKIGEILNQNPSGVLVYRDELIGLLKSLDKDGQEGARSFYLEAWNGTGRFTFDRIGRGTVDIEAACLSVIGGIQPGPLAQYLRGAAKEGKGDDGLIQRFQLLVWPDISSDWVNVDQWPNADARDAAYVVFEGLDHLEPLLLGADTDKFDPGGIPFLHFADDAQGGFDVWRAALEPKVRGGDLQPALESHLAKFRSLIPSLALLIHLADGSRGPVGIGPLQQAIGWGIYLESHARRIYSQAIHPDLAAAKVLAKHILAGDVKDGFALRDVYRKGWSGLGSAEEAGGAADLLADMDWLAAMAIPTAGRTATIYYINPRVHELEGANSDAPPSGATDRTDTSPNDTPSGGSVSDPGGGNPEIPGGTP